MRMLKHVRAVLLLPFNVTIVIPAVILYLTHSLNLGWGLSAPLYLVPTLLGILVIGTGLALLYKTISFFARMGKGTLAPWDPTQKLVVHGIYRHVRNPMISGVFCILLGEAVLVGSVPLLIWFAVFFVLNLIFIPLFEESNLEARFGDEYKLYKENVPRWVPRMEPWEG
jgi:protein-S-isoprenylcysteine O-methyltransferase Ste14